MFVASGHVEGMNLSRYQMIRDAYVYLFLAAERAT